MIIDGGVEIPLPHDGTTWALLVMGVGFVIREGWSYFKHRVAQDRDQIAEALKSNAEQLATISEKLEGMRERVDAKFESLAREFAQQFHALSERIAQNDGVMAVIQSRLDRTEQEVGILREEKHRLREDVTKAIESRFVEVRRLIDTIAEIKTQLVARAQRGA